MMNKKYKILFSTSFNYEILLQKNSKKIGKKIEKILY